MTGQQVLPSSMGKSATSPSLLLRSHWPSDTLWLIVSETEDSETLSGREGAGLGSRTGDFCLLGEGDRLSSLMVSVGRILQKELKVISQKQTFKATSSPS